MSKLVSVLAKPWSYMTGAVCLAILNILLLATTGKPWRVTSGFLNWGAGTLEILGFNPQNWYYFNVYNQQLKAMDTFFVNGLTFINIATILGAFSGALLASEFKWKRIKSHKQWLFALGGGILMGYGTRLSFGCNVGAYFSAIPSFSLHGGVFALFMFFGAHIGVRVLKKYLL
jgi:uncharacterized membrane protein YedE/YeeE